MTLLSFQTDMHKWINIPYFMKLIELIVIFSLNSYVV